jgi:hypothetical protein
MTNLQCMSFTSKSNGEILVAGCQDTMFVIDVNKGEIVKQVSGLSGPVQTCVRLDRVLTTSQGHYKALLHQDEKEPVYLRCHDDGGRPPH